MNYFDYITILKSRPPCLELLPYGHDLIMKGMKAWRQAFVQLGPFKWDTVAPIGSSKDEKSCQDFLWKHAKFDLEKWQTLMGTSAPLGFFEDLVRSGMIFPDGTARLSFFNPHILSTGYIPPTKQEEQQNGSSKRKDG